MKARASRPAAIRAMGKPLKHSGQSVLFASLRERVNKTECPECFKGFPIALISAGLLALAFMGFSGLSIS